MRILATLFVLGLRRQQGACSCFPPHEHKMAPFLDGEHVLTSPPQVPPALWFIRLIGKHHEVLVPAEDQAPATNN